MISLNGTETRMLGIYSQKKLDNLFRCAIISEINWCNNPGALRSESEHRYFRKREKILRRYAERKYIYLHETEDGRVY